MIYLSALKEKFSELSFFNFDDYKEESIIGEGATSSVKIVIKKEKYAKKELKDFTHKTMQRFLSEGEILFILRHPCIISILLLLSFLWSQNHLKQQLKMMNWITG